MGEGRVLVEKQVVEGRGRFGCQGPFFAPFQSTYHGLALVKFEPNISCIYTPQFKSWVSLLRSTRMKIERIESSETSAIKPPTPGDYPENTIRQK